MEINDEREQHGHISCRADSSDDFSTFGGEYWIDDDHYCDYGLDCNDVVFYGLNARQYKNLGLAIINHLMVNGYDFEIGRDHNGDYLREKR